MKNKLLVVLLIGMILLTSGCGTNDYIKDDKNQIVSYKETGQNLPNNILCKPSENSNLINYHFVASLN